jgi:hypothetical protein
MATAGIEITAEMAELRELQQAIGRLFSPADKARILKAALEKAIEPAYQRLQQLTPIGPTGNLRRAVAKKVKTYTKSGTAVGLIGFRRAGQERSESAAGGRVQAGPDRAFHQWWLEEGTKDRVIKAPSPPKSYNRPGFTRPGFERKAYTMTRKGKTFRVSPTSVRGHAVTSHVVNDPNSYYYASSFNSLGPFKIQKFRNGEKGFITDPGYPNAFFRKSRSPITITAMRPGGSSGPPPLKTAWDQTQPTVAEILQRELRLSLEQAVSTLARSASGVIGE